MRHGPQCCTMAFCFARDTCLFSLFHLPIWTIGIGAALSVPFQDVFMPNSKLLSGHRGAIAPAMMKRGTQPSRIPNAILLIELLGWHKIITPKWEPRRRSGHYGKKRMKADPEPLRFTGTFGGGGETTAALCNFPIDTPAPLGWYRPP